MGPAFRRSRLGALLLAGALVCYVVPRMPFYAPGTHAQLMQAKAGVLNALLLADSSDLGPVARDTTLSLVLELKNPSAGREAGDLAAMYTPGSKSYGHYLTASEVAARYGPPATTVARVRGVLASLGLVAAWQPGDDWLAVSGPAKCIEKAFGVSARWYRSPRGTRYYAGDRDPSLPAALQPYVAEVGSLSNYVEPIQAAVPEGGLAPVDLVGAYDITPLRKAGLDGAGQTVVFYESTGFRQADFDAFTTKYNLPTMQPVVKAGPTFASPGAETEMDLEVVHEIAPAAKLIIYNFDWDAAQRGAASSADLFNDSLELQAQMVDENPGAVISQSYGICEPALGKAQADAVKTLYDHADALGETVFGITMDSGAYPCLADVARGTAPSAAYLGVTLPGDAPGVTAVGGTRLSVSANGGWYDETVWEDPGETNGTGGGVSTYFPRPTWQAGNGVLDPQLNPKGMRSVPDVSADADPASGAAIFAPLGDGTSGFTEGGGTSQSAPIWAGIAALIDQYLQQKGLPSVGFMNPALYHIAAHPDPATAFHDVTIGTNLYYPATPGYDMATGLGTPEVWNLTQDLEKYERGGGQ